MEGTEKQPTSLEIKERNFYKQLKDLPQDFANSWREKYDNEIEEEEIDEFLAEFYEFVKKRNLVLAGSSIEINADTDPIIKEEILRVQESIKKTFGDHNFFLGNGATAEVYLLPIAPSLCVKYISEQEAYNDNNHIRKEYQFLEELHDTEVAGVRTPHPYFVRIHPSEGHSYGMERIDGENLSRILEDPEVNVDLIKLLKEKDRKQVELSLLEYIESIHTRFKITHNDLFKRNIMVDRAGNFYIIDFGKAKEEEVGEDHEIFRTSDIARLTSEIRSFFERVDEIDINAIMHVNSNHIPGRS